MFHLFLILYQAVCSRCLQLITLPVMITYPSVVTVPSPAPRKASYIQSTPVKMHLLAFLVLFSIHCSAQAVLAVPPSLYNPSEIIDLQWHIEHWLLLFVTHVLVVLDSHLRWAICCAASPRETWKLLSSSPRTPPHSLCSSISLQVTVILSHCTCFKSSSLMSKMRCKVLAKMLLLLCQMGPFFHQQFFFLKESPVVIKAKALSLTAWCWFAQCIFCYLSFSHSLAGFRERASRSPCLKG